MPDGAWLPASDTQDLEISMFIPDFSLLSKVESGINTEILDAWRRESLVQYNWWCNGNVIAGDVQFSLTWQGVKYGRGNLGPWFIRCIYINHTLQKPTDVG